MPPFVDLVRGPDSSTTDQDDTDQPEAHHGQLGVAEQVQAELEAEDELREGDHKEDPALGAQPLTPGVSDIGVILSDGGGRYQACHQYSQHANGMLCGHGEDVFDEEGVELHHLPDQHQLDDGHQPHVTGLRIQPSDMGPTLRGELQQGPLELALGPADVLDGLPLVLPHLQEPADLHPSPDSQSIAQHHVQHQVVPPTLVEVWKEVAEHHLGELPHDGDGPEDAVVSDHQGLHAPAPVVTKCKPVQVGVESLPGDVPTIHPVLLNIMNM